MKFALVCGICFALMAHVPYVTLRWIFPCNSATVGYFLIPECGNDAPNTGKWATSSTLFLAFICVWTLVVVVDGGGTYSLFLVSYSMAHAYCLRRYVQYFTQGVKRNPGKWQELLPTYRQIQILSRYYNNIQQGKLIVSNITLLMTGLVISFYTIITLGLEVSVPELVLFATVAQDAVLALVMYNTFMGQLYKASKSVNGLIKASILSTVSVTEDRKWIVKYLRSFRAVKCYVGYTNFVDELSPLVFLSFCVDQIASLLLVH